MTMQMAMWIGVLWGWSTLVFVIGYLCGGAFSMNGRLEQDAGVQVLAASRRLTEAMRVRAPVRVQQGEPFIRLVSMPRKNGQGIH